MTIMKIVKEYLKKLLKLTNNLPLNFGCSANVQENIILYAY